MAAGLPQLRFADSEDADAAEGVVVLDRVARVESREARRDLPGRRPVGGPPPGEAEPARDEVDVRVRRDQEPVRRDPRPEAEVEPIPTHHPAQIEVPALAGGAGRRVGEEESNAGIRPEGGAGRGRDGSRGAAAPATRGRGGPRRPLPRGGTPTRSARAATRRSCRAPPDREEERRGVFRAVEPVPEAGEALAREARESPRLGRASRAGEGPSASRRRRHVRPDRLDPPVGESRRDPAGDLDVLRRAVPREKTDRVAPGRFGPVSPVEELEPRPEEAFALRTIHARILPSLRCRESGPERKGDPGRDRQPSRCRAPRPRSTWTSSSGSLDTAGGVEVARFVKERAAPDPATFIGKGSVEEVGAAAEEHGAKLVVFDEELTPAQTRNLERAWDGVRVLDRPGLILDVFASHARTREARTQVELAQLQYLLPRLAGRYDRLSGLRGGIGARGGAGEQKLELDRRRIRDRIARLRRDLAKIETARDVRRRGRQRILPGRDRRLHERRQDDALQPADAGVGVRRRPALRDPRLARGAGGFAQAPRRRLPRHGRLRAQAPARPRRLVPLDAGRDPRRGPRPARARRLLRRGSTRSGKSPPRSSPSSPSGRSGSCRSGTSGTCRARSGRPPRRACPRRRAPAWRSSSR